MICLNFFFSLSFSMIIFTFKKIQLFQLKFHYFDPVSIFYCVCVCEWCLCVFSLLLLLLSIKMNKYLERIIETHTHTRLHNVFFSSWFLYKYWFIRELNWIQVLIQLDSIIIDVKQSIVWFDLPPFTGNYFPGSILCVWIFR